jgi:hypothetical protein
MAMLNNLSVYIYIMENMLEARFLKIHQSTGFFDTNIEPT